MRITRSMLEIYVSDMNNAYDLSLSVQYFNGCTHIYNNGYSIETGTTSECYRALQIFMNGFYVGREFNNSEVV